MKRAIINVLKWILAIALATGSFWMLDLYTTLVVNMFVDYTGWMYDHKYFATIVMLVGLFALTNFYRKILGRKENE